MTDEEARTEIDARFTGCQGGGSRAEKTVTIQIELGVGIETNAVRWIADVQQSVLVAHERWVFELERDRGRRMARVAEVCPGRRAREKAEGERQRSREAAEASGDHTSN